jgi:hypothetical protein
MYRYRVKETKRTNLGDTGERISGPQWQKEDLDCFDRKKTNKNMSTKGKIGKGNVFHFPKRRVSESRKNTKKL